MLEKSNKVSFDVPSGFEKDKGLHDMFESNLQEIDEGLHDYDSLEGKFIAEEFIPKRDSFLLILTHLVTCTLFHLLWSMARVLAQALRTLIFLW